MTCKTAFYAHRRFTNVDLYDIEHRWSRLAKNPYQPKNISSTEELLAYYDESLEEGRARLSVATEEQLVPLWTLRNGEEVYNVSSKAEVIRMYCQNVHRRAQLGVYLRLLDIPIPGSYGPSADELNP